MGRLLRIFEDVLTPLERMVDVLPLHFDPTLTPEEFLPWLAMWIDVVLDERIPLRQRRELVRRAVWLHRWRGTARALREHLRICLGVTPLITELTDGMELRGDARLGLNARLGRPRRGHIVVTIASGDDRDIDIELAKAVMHAQIPAGVTYALQVVKPGSRKTNRGKEVEHAVR
jgi:phage tail-like protein